MWLKHLQDVLKTYNDLLKTVVGVAGTLSGWIFAFWKYRRAKTPLLAISINDTNAIVLQNHGTQPLEVLHASLALRDPTSRPDLAKKHSFMLGVAGVVSPAGQLQLGKVDGLLEDAIRDITRPFENTLELYGGSAAHSGVHVSVDLFLTYAPVGTVSPKVQRFERWLSGYFGRGWTLHFSPYYHVIRAPWHRKAIRAIAALTKAARTPLQSFRARRQLRKFGVHLDVMGILQAAAQKTITTEEAGLRLERIARRSNMSLGDLVDHHIKWEDRTVEDNKAFLQRHGEPGDNEE